MTVEELAHELRDNHGRWTKGSLLGHGVEMRPIGRVEGSPAQAVSHNGAVIGSVRSTGRGFTAHYGPDAPRVNPAGRRLPGPRGRSSFATHPMISQSHASIAEAAAHVMAHHQVHGGEALPPKKGKAKSEREVIADAAAQGGKVRDKKGNLVNPKDLALQHLAVARRHLAGGDVEAAHNRILDARKALPANSFGRGHVWNAMQAKTAGGKRPHVIAAQKALGLHNASALTPEEEAAKALEHAGKAQQKAAEQKAPLVPPKIAGMDRGGKYIGRLPDGSTAWHVVHAPASGIEQDRVYIAKGGEVRLATEADMGRITPAGGFDPGAKAANKGKAAKIVAAQSREPAQLKADAAGSTGIAQRVRTALQDAAKYLDNANYYHRQGGEAREYGAHQNLIDAKDALGKALNALPAGHPQNREISGVFKSINNALDNLHDHRAGDDISAAHNAVVKMQEADKGLVKSPVKPAYPLEVARRITEWRAAKQRADAARGPQAAQSAHRAQLRAESDLKAAGYVLKAGRWVEAPNKSKAQPKPDPEVEAARARIRSGADPMAEIAGILKAGERSAARDRRAREAARIAALGPAPKPDASGFAKFDRKRHGDLKRGNTIKVKGFKEPRIVVRSQYQHKGPNKGQVIYHSDAKSGLPPKHRGVADMERHTIESGKITHVKVRQRGPRPFDPHSPNHGGGPSAASPDDRSKGGRQGVENRAWHSQAYNALPEDQRTAVRNYMGGVVSGPGSASEVNNALRRGQEHHVTALIDPAIASHRLAQPTTLWRGRDYYFGLEKRPDFKVGQVISDKAYTSASSARKVGYQFASSGNKRARGGHMFKIELPTGYPALPTPPHPPDKRVGMYHDEREVLLPRGTKMQITHLSNPDKNNVVTVTLKPHEATPSQVEAPPWLDNPLMQDLMHERVEANPNAALHQEGGDPFFGKIAEAAGFTGQPRVVSEAEMNKLVADGAIEVLRGLPQREHAEAFRSGELWPGHGIWGSGTYTYDAKTRFGDPWLKGMLTKATGGNNEGMLRIAIPPEAVIEYGDAYYGAKADMAKLDQMIEAGQGDVAGLKRVRDAITKNIGRWAALNGYQAIHIPDEDLYNILDRGAVAVERMKGQPKTVREERHGT